MIPWHEKVNIIDEHGNSHPAYRDYQGRSFYIFPYIQTPMRGTVFNLDDVEIAPAVMWIGDEFNKPRLKGGKG